jgi:hypothetical protein
MSNEQIESINYTLYQRIFPWLLTGLLSVNVWFFSNWMHNQDELMKTVEELKTDMRELKTTLQIMKEFDLKKKF